VTVCLYGGGSHGWLRRDSLVVDITADQFDDPKLEKVTVRRHSPWHEEQYDETCNCGDYRLMDTGEYDGDYGKLLEYIEEQRQRKLRLKRRPLPLKRGNAKKV
jgi:hypothetical protein